MGTLRFPMNFLLLKEKLGWIFFWVFCPNNLLLESATETQFLVVKGLLKESSDGLFFLVNSATPFLWQIACVTILTSSQRKCIQIQSPKVHPDRISSATGQALNLEHDQPPETQSSSPNRSNHQKSLQTWL